MITFRVPDMTCGHCAGTIAKAIAAEDPAARVEFDIATRVVRVDTTSATTAELEQAIRRAGYSPSQEAQPRQRSNGCGCGCGPARSPTVGRPQPASIAKIGCCG